MSILEKMLLDYSHRLFLYKTLSTNINSLQLIFPATIITESFNGDVLLHTFLHLLSIFFYKEDLFLIQLLISISTDSSIFILFYGI